MASYFYLTLDTVAPADLALTINTNATTVTSTSVTLGISVSDADTTGYTMLIYGDIGPGVLEGDATWENFATSKAITLKTGDGLKTVKVKVRDDVGNASAEATVAVTLDTTVPVGTISAGPDHTKISTTGVIVASAFSFTSDSEFTEYKVKVVPATNSIHTAGTAIGTTNGSTNMAGTGTFSAGTPISCSIVGLDYSAAVSGVSGTAFIVKVFLKDTAGLWSV